MKFLNYIASLFVPTKMVQRKNINVLVSFAILLLSSLVIAIPYISKFKEIPYDVYCDYASYDFRVMDEEYSKEIPFTTEEINKFGDKYILTTVDELNDINFVVKGGEVVLPDGVNTYKDLEYNDKEYILKREVYNYDSEGTKLDQVDIYYIHIVFDIFKDIKEGDYKYRDDFDKTFNTNDENHYLIAFFVDGLIYRNEYMISKNIQSYGYNFKKVDIDFSEMNTLDYITNKMALILVPYTIQAYTFNGFLYTVFAGFVLAFAGYVIIRNKNNLNKYKHYFNVAALSSIPITLLFFILEWNNFFISIGIMDLYWCVFAIYYFVVLFIINKTSRVKI